MRFNPHSRKTPSGTQSEGEIEAMASVSILTRGKPRVEREYEELDYPQKTVSILTRGKPRVEHKVFSWILHRGKFQSSLEENPEWNFL